MIGADIGGMAVHIGARVVGQAAPSEVLVSSAVEELVLGSGIEFTDRGARELKGVPGEWRLLAVRGSAGPGLSEPAAEPTDQLAPNATLVTRADRAALRFARRAPGAARLISRAMSRGRLPDEERP